MSHSIQTSYTVLSVDATSYIAILISLIIEKFIHKSSLNKNITINILLIHITHIPVVVHGIIEATTDFELHLWLMTEVLIQYYIIYIINIIGSHLVCLFPS